MTWDEYFDFDSIISAVYDSYEDYGISLFRLGQIVGSDCDPKEADVSALFNESFFYLVSKCRRPIYESLYREFGDDGELFVSLWLSNKPKMKTKKVSQKVLDEAYRNQRAFEYILLGMTGIDA